MNLFITILLYFASVVGSIWFVKSKVKKAISNSETLQLLGSGKEGIKEGVKSKIKEMVKKPLDNPDTAQDNDNEPKLPIVGNKPNGIRFFGNRDNNIDNPLLPMNGMNGGANPNMPGLPMNGMNGGANPNMPGLPMNGMNGGAGAQPVGAGIVQMGINAAVVPMAGSVNQAGLIANIAPAQKIAGPMLQTGVVLNGKTGTIKTLNQLTNLGLNRSKRIERINQMAGTNINSAKRLGTVNQVAGTNINTTKRIGRVNSNGQTAIIGPKGWINYKQYGSSYINGSVNNASLPSGSIHTNQLQIKGFSKVETIVAKTFTDPSGKIAAIRKGAMPYSVGKDSAPYAVINQGPNVGIALNDALVQKNSKYQMENKRLFLSQDQHQQLAMLELKKVYTNPENRGMNHNQLVKLASFNRNRLLSDNPNRGGDESWYRSALMSLPTGLGNNEIEKIAHKAKSLKDAVDRNSSMLAVARTDYKMGDPNKNALNNVLKETSSITRNFYNYLEKNNPSEDITHINEDEMKDIEKKARENVEARGDLSLEDKEKQYEAEVQKQVEDEKQRKMEEAEDSLKEEILSNPELAKEVLGEKGQEALEKEIDKVKKKRKDTYKEYLKRQESMKDEQFAKNHPEISNANKYEVRKKRYENERRRFIEKAAESEDISGDYNTTNNVRYYSENLLKAE